MRKIASILIMMTLLVSLTACSKKTDVTEIAAGTQVQKMYIQEAELTDEEKSLIKLVGVEDMPYIVEVSLDDTVKSWQTNIYELENGKWKLISDGVEEFIEPYTRIALTFKNIGYGLKIAIENCGYDSYKQKPDFDFEGLGTGNSYLINQMEIEYEKEIPLVIQVHTSKSNISCISPEYGFYDPKMYADLGYEKVYAITCVFSQKTVAELAQANKC